jgi:hypothetical protein
MDNEVKFETAATREQVEIVMTCIYGHVLDDPGMNVNKVYRWYGDGEFGVNAYDVEEVCAELTVLEIDYTLHS